MIVIVFLLSLVSAVTAAVSWSLKNWTFLFVVPCVSLIFIAYATSIVRFYDKAIDYFRGLDRLSVAYIVWAAFPLAGSYAGLIVCVQKYAWAGLIFLPVPALASYVGCHLKDIIDDPQNWIFMTLLRALSGTLLLIAVSLSFLVIWTFVKYPVYIGVCALFPMGGLWLAMYYLWKNCIDPYCD